MKTIHVSASRQYDVLIEKGLIHQAGQVIRPLVKGSKAFVVTDSNVAPLYLDSVLTSLQESGFATSHFVFPAGEQSKCGAMYLQLLSALAGEKITRADCVVALGGGVTGDLTGFAAATYLRGMAYVQIPTTLLAMVDSSVGGKTAIDLPEGKNLCGAFYQPHVVICDPDVLSTLPDDVFSDGCAEVIKYGFIGSEKLLRMLSDTPVRDQLEDVISLCVGMKRDIVEQDEFDTGLRQLLNLGHTFAHGVEVLSDFQVSHGKAVAIGMAIVTRAAVKRGVCDRQVLDALLSLLCKCHLPCETAFAPEQLHQMALSDKKRSADTLTLVVPTGLGVSELKKIPVNEALLWAQEGVMA